MKRFFLLLTLIFTAFSLTSCEKSDYVIKFSWWGTSD